MVGYKAHVTDERTAEMDHDDIVILNRGTADPLTARTFCALFVTVDGEFKDDNYWYSLSDDKVMAIYLKHGGD